MLGKAVQLWEPSKSSSGYGLMAHSTSSEGRRGLDRRANFQPVCGYISKKVSYHNRDASPGKIAGTMHNYQNEPHHG
jgi:hypothetical protein